MGKWLISTLTEEAWEQWRMINHPYIRRVLYEEDYGEHFGDRILIYDDERDEFSNQIKFHPWLHDDDLVCPKFCNARTVYKVWNPEERGEFEVEPQYSDQTILSELWPDEAIPQDRIRYFVIHKRILEENDAETYKIVGNDRTNKYVGLEELNILLKEGLIVNHEDLRGKLPVFYEAHEKENRKNIMFKAELYARNSRGLGLTYPDLDYVFLGDEVIVTGINEKWLNEQERTPVIKNLVFPDGVTKIADGAFMTGEREIHILKVTLKPTIKEIGGFAFFGREELSSVDFIGAQDFNGSRLKRIGEYAFYGCKKLNLDVGIFSEFTEFENGVFYECNSVNVNFKEKPGVHRIGMLAFKGTKVNMELPESLKEIDAYAFSKSVFVNKNVVIPDSVTYIADSAFSESVLFSVVLPKNLTVLPDFMFDNCKYLQLPELPDSLKKIGICCFRECHNMTGTLEMPESLEEIGECAFEHTALNKVVFTSKIKSIPEFLLKNCKELQEVILPYGITSIGHESFCKCKNLTDIHIPSSVHTIYSKAFLGCEKLDKVEYEPDLLLHLGYSAFNKEIVEGLMGEYPGNSKVKISVDPLKKGDLVVLMAGDDSCPSETYGIFDHMTEGDWPKAYVWFLPWFGMQPCTNESELLKQHLQEINLIVRKVIYDENNVAQRISREYLCKRYKIDIINNTR